MYHILMEDRDLHLHTFQCNPEQKSSITLHRTCASKTVPQMTKLGVLERGREWKWKWGVFHLQRRIQGSHYSKGIDNFNLKQQSFGINWAAIRWEGQCKTYKLLKRSSSRIEKRIGAKTMHWLACTKYCFHTSDLFALESYGKYFG